MRNELLNKNEDIKYISCHKLFLSDPQLKIISTNFDIKEVSDCTKLQTLLIAKTECVKFKGT